MFLLLTSLCFAIEEQNVWGSFPRLTLLLTDILPQHAQGSSLNLTRCAAVIHGKSILSSRRIASSQIHNDTSGTMEKRDQFFPHSFQAEVPGRLLTSIAQCKLEAFFISSEGIPLLDLRNEALRILAMREAESVNTQSIKNLRQTFLKVGHRLEISGVLTEISKKM